MPARIYTKLACIAITYVHLKLSDSDKNQLGADAYLNLIMWNVLFITF